MKIFNLKFFILVVFYYLDEEKDEIYIANDDNYEVFIKEEVKKSKSTKVYIINVKEVKFFNF